MLDRKVTTLRNRLVPSRDPRLPGRLLLAVLALVLVLLVAEDDRGPRTDDRNEGGSSSSSFFSSSSIELEGGKAGMVSSRFMSWSRSLSRSMRDMIMSPMACFNYLYLYTILLFLANCFIGTLTAKLVASRARVVLLQLAPLLQARNTCTLYSTTLL
jgi:hypothetical protein